MSDAWIGLVHVRPLPNHEPLGAGARGAYANVLALADSPEGYRAAVAEVMSGEKLLLVGIEDVRPIDAVVLAASAQEIRELSERLSAEWPVQFHTFDTYYMDDA